MNTVFVFGSNLAGRHGAGAARDAKLYWGAENGCGIGPTGNSYAIPTKDWNLNTLPLDYIEKHWAAFCIYASSKSDKHFLVTPFGCGLAGYSISDIIPMMQRHPLPYNASLTSSWLNHMMVLIGK